MALTIKHLNTDASFLLTFTPSTPPSVPQSPPFHILLDPWITGPSKILHSKISLTRHKHPACITSLTQLPTPNLVIISQSKSDHCNEATLRQLPCDGPTLILADPAATRIIRSWRYFDPRKVRALRRYGGGGGEDDGDAVIRIPLLQGGSGGGGEVSIAWIPQRRDLTGLHAAVGITFRPPAPSTRGGGPGQPVVLATPPATPVSPTSTLRSVRSLSTLTTLTPTLTNASTLAAAHHHHHHLSAQRTLSLLFSPHGMSFAGPLSLYATTHLVNEAALPLTALLHCIDSVSNPWWLGGNVLLGAPAGREIARRLGARVWVSCHDGAKEVSGLATGWLRTRRWEREDVQKGVCEEEEHEVVRAEKGEVAQREQDRPAIAGPETAEPTPKTTRSAYAVAGKYGGRTTQVLDLASGEEVILTWEGVWDEAGAQLARKSWRVDAETGPSLVAGRSSNLHTFDKVMASAPVAGIGERCL
ncbi:hypothetical protein N0V82_002581 [Gnomoniopsis sp. IMI 355080]|nr:hypothetical protein N0V82_002581 [Gnomoniopsis sp. IMI 355080]